MVRGTALLYLGRVTRTRDEGTVWCALVHRGWWEHSAQKRWPLLRGAKQE